mmetsp:Transcript_5517/g.20839  ORF Transcript_5517/g.20839 Transcript_5517/m.20839 type:complete len:150 (+) Transcript_5517:2759-3208(+)
MAAPAAAAAVALGSPGLAAWSSPSLTSSSAARGCSMRAKGCRNQRPAGCCVRRLGARGPGIGWTGRHPRSDEQLVSGALRRAAISSDLMWACARAMPTGTSMGRTSMSMYAMDISMAATDVFAVEVCTVQFDAGLAYELERSSIFNERV